MEWLKNNILSLIAVVLAAIQVVQGMRNPSSIVHIGGWIVVALLLALTAFLQWRAALSHRSSTQQIPEATERQVWFFSPGICVSLNRSSSAVRVALNILSTERAELVHVWVELRDTNKGTTITCESSEPMMIEKLVLAAKVIEQKISPDELAGFVRGAMYQVSGYAKFRDGDKITSQRIEINTIPSI